MKKLFSLVLLLAVTLNTFSAPSKSGTIFDSIISPKAKEMLNDVLKKESTDKHTLDFKGKFLENLDLSGMYLRDIDFNGCTLINVDLRDADLTNTRWTDAQFVKVNLVGATLSKGFKLETEDHYELIKLYSDTMKDYKNYKRSHPDQENEFLKNKLDSLNNLFPPLRLQLSSKNLENLELTDVNLNYANLCYSSLQNTWLSNTVQVPDSKFMSMFSSDFRRELKNYFIFHKWMNGNEEEQKCYQKLINARCDLFLYIFPKFLIKDHRVVEKPSESNVSQDMNWTNKDLSNSVLDLLDLRNFDLRGTKLKNASLYGSKLQGVKLSENVTVPNYENPNQLFNLWSNETPEYQKLVNAKFDLFTGLSVQELSKVTWVNKDLHNSWLEKVDFSNLNLNGVNFENAYLQNVKFVGTNLAHTNFRGSFLRDVEFEGVDLTGADFRTSTLSKVTLKNSDMKDVKLTNIKIDAFKSNCFDVNLKDIDLSGLTIMFGDTSEKTALSKNCTDQTLIEEYQKCKDEIIKKLFKQILVAKNLPVN